MLKMTGYVMLLAPVAVFAAVAVALAEQGVDIIAALRRLCRRLLCRAGAGVALLLAAERGRSWARPRLKACMAAIRQPALIAFTTASSEAAYPSLLARLEEFGVPNRIAALVLPLGYSFNLVGSMCYCTWAVMFLAQAYDVRAVGLAAGADAVHAVRPVARASPACRAPAS